MENEEINSEEISEPMQAAPSSVAVVAWRLANQAVIDLDKRIEELGIRRREVGEQVAELTCKANKIVEEMRRLTGMRRGLVNKRFDAAKKMHAAAAPELRALESALKTYESDARANADVDWNELSGRLHALRASEAWMRECVQGEVDDPLRVQAQVARLNEALPSFTNVFLKSLERFT